MVGPSTVPDPYGGFDTVNIAGVIVWTDEDSSGETDEHNRQWWADIGEDSQTAYLKELAEIYTEWVNGHNYRYSIVVMGTCDMDYEHPETTIDSCGGFIGMEHLADGLRDVIPDDLEPDKVQWAGDAGDIGTYLKLDREATQ